MLVRLGVLIGEASRVAERTGLRRWARLVTLLASESVSEGGCRIVIAGTRYGGTRNPGTLWCYYGVTSAC